ncbi:hypothetical protein F5887DRAFT_1244657 [Amanita rubescens]|nr:hypothetical protein F5887DRAFT_1244657 [Amanita rubescens]
MSAQERVPTEILCEVFHFLQVPILFGTVDFPWAVGQVCKRWRNAFISCPHLWTSLALRWDLKYFRGAAYMADSETNRLTAIYVERSGQLPLTISIYLSGTRGPRPTETMKTLVSCSKRWKSLDICIDPGTEMELLECEGNLPNLTTLIIRGNVASDLSRIFEVAPRLTYLDVSGRIGQIAFPWAQLTRFRIFMCWEDYSRYGNELWQALLQLQNVETLELLGVPYVPSLAVAQALPEIPVQLPRLLLLEIQLGFFEVFSQFNAPSLEHLRIDDRHNWDADTYTTQIEQWYGVLSLINRSSCHVRRLTLLQGTFNASVDSTLKALASVEELIIEYPGHMFPTLLRFISMDDWDGSICLPKLRVLKMRYCPAHIIGGVIGTISRFLKLRDNGSRKTRASCVSLEQLIMKVTPPSCVPLEKLVIQLQWCSSCNSKNIDISWNDSDLEAIRSWPSDIDICIDDSEVKNQTRDLLAPGNSLSPRNITYHYNNLTDLRSNQIRLTHLLRRVTYGPPPASRIMVGKRVSDDPGEGGINPFIYTLNLLSKHQTDQIDSPSSPPPHSFNAHSATTSILQSSVETNAHPGKEKGESPAMTKSSFKHPLRRKRYADVLDLPSLLF